MKYATRYKKKLTRSQRQLVYACLRGLGYPDSMISEDMIRKYHFDQWTKEMTRSFDEMEDEMRQEFIKQFQEKYGNAYRQRPTVRRKYIDDSFVVLTFDFED